MKSSIDLEGVVINLPMGALIFVLCVSCDGAENGSNAKTEQANANENSNNPFYINNLCRVIYSEGSSSEDVAAETKSYFEDQRWFSEVAGVYRLKNGNYAAAQTLDAYYENPTKYLRGKGRDFVDPIDPFMSVTPVYTKLPTARCTNGSDIESDTGVRVQASQELNTGGLAGLVIGAALDAMTTKPSSTSNSDYIPTNEYIIRCFDATLFEDDKIIDVPLGSCEGEESDCRNKLYDQIDREFYGYSNFCTRYLKDPEYRTGSIRVK